MRGLTLSAFIFLSVFIYAFVSAHPASDAFPGGNEGLPTPHPSATNDNGLADNSDDSVPDSLLLSRTPWDELAVLENLPLSKTCKSVIREFAAGGKSAIHFIRGTVCQKYQCKVPTSSLLQEYGPYVRNTVVLKWIFGLLKTRGLPVNFPWVKATYDEIIRDCITSNQEFMAVQDICTDSGKSLPAIKTCIIGQLMPHFNFGFLPWIDKACEIARRDKLVDRVSTSTISTAVYLLIMSNRF